MGIAFNADEIYEIGVEIEKNGKKFYEIAAEAAKEPIVKAFFSRLAQWENEHIQLFSKLKTGLPENARREVAFDPNGELARYLKAAADTHVFRADADVPGMVSRCQTAIDALSLALTFEKDSVVLYSAMRNFVPQDLGKGEIEKILDEELKHMVIITDEMNKLKKP